MSVLESRSNGAQMATRAWRTVFIARLERPISLARRIKCPTFPGWPRCGKVLSACALILIIIPAARAENEGCYTTFYQTKNVACIDALAKVIPGLKTNPTDPSDHANEEAVVGFFAAIFADLPQQRERLLHKDGITATTSLYVESLYRSGLQEDAKAYADDNGLTDVFMRYQNQHLDTIKSVSPDSMPSDNDLLIGAYMASGNIEYIKRMLENFTRADDASVRDAFRMGLMQGMFGGKLAPPGRDRVMIPELCAKYECKQSPRRFLREMTLSSAFWALQSLARQDQAINKTFADFFEGDPRLKKLLGAEKAAFSNYLTALAAYGAIKDNPNINASLLAYEKLGSAQEATDTMRPVH